MTERAPVPTNVNRQLWAESIGYCMNPDCHAGLIQNGVSIAHRAHIIPHADGGDVSFENLLLLCTNCHTYFDGARTKATIPTFRKWKARRHSEILQKFTQQYESFNELRYVVVPIVHRNGQIFDSYGPLGDPSENETRRQLWLQFEGELVSNNRQLELLLSANRHLFHLENWTTIERFISHVREFAATRDEELSRVNLFPPELPAIFGIESVDVGFPPNLSALQNFVSYLIQQKRLITLDLNLDPCIVYFDSEGEKLTLRLANRPWVQQVLWDGRFFKPQTTEVRIGDLVFFVKWLHKAGIQYNFDSLSDLTTLTLNGTHRVKLCYKYVLSLTDVQEMPLSEGDIVVNQHMWNDGPIDGEAHSYAAALGIRLYNQKEFFVYAHRNIK